MTGAMVGDPRNNTSDPTLNMGMKPMAITSLVFGSAVNRFSAQRNLGRGALLNIGLVRVNSVG